MKARLSNVDCCIHFPTTPFHLPHVEPYLRDKPSVSPFPGWNQPWQSCLSSISSVLPGKTRLALCDYLSIKRERGKKKNPCLYVPASSYPLIIRPLSRNNIPHFGAPALHSLPCATSRIHPHSLIPPSSFLKATCSQPVWLSCTLPMKGFLLGWDWVQPSRALAGSEAEAGASSPSSSAPTATPHACSGLALSPRSRLLVSAVPNCLQRQKRARTRERVGTALACWAVTWQARTQRFVFMLPRSGLGGSVIF